MHINSLGMSLPRRVASVSKSLPLHFGPPSPQNPPLGCWPNQLVPLTFQRPKSISGLISFDPPQHLTQTPLSTHIFSCVAEQVPPTHDLSHTPLPSVRRSAPPHPSHPCSPSQRRRRSASRPRSGSRSGPVFLRGVPGGGQTRGTTPEVHLHHPCLGSRLALVAWCGETEVTTGHRRGQHIGEERGGLRLRVDSTVDSLPNSHDLTWKWTSPFGLHGLPERKGPWHPRWPMLVRRSVVKYMRHHRKRQGKGQVGKHEKTWPSFLLCRSLRTPCLRL